MSKLMNRLSLTLIYLPILTACQSRTAPAQPLPSAQPTASPTPMPSSQPTASPIPSSTPSPTPVPSVEPTPQITAAPQNLLAGLRLEAQKTYLDYYGQSSQLKPIFLDARGQVIMADYPIEWTSSSPSLLSVTAQGLVKALVSYGYATITAKVPGTQLSASTLITVQGSGGGGGGGSSTPSAPGNSPPQIISLTSSASTVLGARSIVKIQALAQDADDTLTNASYNWSCSPAATCGSFSQTDGTSTYWTSTSTPGDQTITLKVSDGKAETQQSLTISVKIGTVNVNIN